MKGKKWRRRVRAAEGRVAALEVRTNALAREHADLKQKVRELELLTGSGLTLMLNDLARHVNMPGDGLTISREVEHAEFVDGPSGQVHRFPMLQSYDVEYSAPDGTVWLNGKAVAKESWKV